MKEGKGRATQFCMIQGNMVVSVPKSSREESQSNFELVLCKYKRKPEYLTDFFVFLEIEPRILHIPGECYITKLHPQPLTDFEVHLFVLFCFRFNWS